MDYNLTALAVVPGVLILIYVYTRDKVEHEPIGLIIKLLIFGGLSAVVAGFAESAAESVLPSYSNGSLEYALVNAFLLAGFWEELLKYSFLKFGSWKHKAFNYRFDGIVYGATVAVGFAILENVMYVYSYGFATGVVRAFTAVPLHSFCGITMGIFYAVAKKNSIIGRNGASRWYRFLAFVVPMTVHGIYDTLAFMPTMECTLMLYAFVLILYVIAVKVIRGFSKADATAGFYPEARVIEYTVEV